MPWKPADAVPRRMLEMCKDTLRRCLASRIELKRDLDRAEAENARLKRMLDRHNHGDR